MKPFRCFKRKQDPVKFGSGGTVWRYEGTDSRGRVKLGGPVIDIATRYLHLIAYHVPADEFENDWEKVHASS